MYRLLFLFIFGFFCSAVNSYHCPEGSIEIPNEDVCMFAVNQTKFYLGASLYCRSLGGVPVKIQNTFENTYVFSMTKQESLNNLSPYIGVERKMNNIWTYADGSPLTYQNWALNEPNNSSNTSLCTIMDPQSGSWLAAECSFARPFFCSINGDDFQCPDGWLYNKETDYCYFLQNFTYTDGVYWQLYNFTTAEANCRRMGSHLVSIHSEKENNFVFDLVYANALKIPITTPDNSSCARQWAWIGYYGNGTVGVGTWTDGSLVDFTFGSLHRDMYYYLISNDPSCNYRVWTWASNAPSFSRFVCKRPSKSRFTKEKAFLEKF